MNNINSILSEVVKRVSPSIEELNSMKKLVNEFIVKIEKRIKNLRIKAEIFVGGSFAKSTLIKKDHYDIDVFLRFDKKYENLSELTEKILKGTKIQRIHGSRDYFKINIKENVYIELVPVRKIQRPRDAENITDLSYSHVKYIKSKIKSQKIINDIRISKAFCYANNCYGAESYIGGFSGYALELLVYYYKGFVNFLKAMEKLKAKPLVTSSKRGQSKGKKDKLVIDIEKQYKDKKEIMMNINTSKLESPIILIDPTYKQRNALAALREETFDKFKKEASRFLKNPGLESFEIKKTDIEKIKKEAKNKGYEFILLEADTDKQPGDIAGSKLLKFHRHFEEEIKPFFDIKNKGFNYNKEKTARYFFVAKSKGEIIVNGPKAEDKENVLKFRKKHKNTFTNKKNIFAREKIKFSLKEFIENWKSKNKQKMIGMSVIKLENIS